MREHGLLQKRRPREPELYQAAKLFELLPQKSNDLWQMDVTYIHIPGYGWALRWLGKVPGTRIFGFAFPGGRYIILPRKPEAAPRRHRQRQPEHTKTTQSVRQVVWRPSGQADASFPGEEPRCEIFDRKWLRKMRGVPEPFPQDWQERFISSLLYGEKFRLAVRAALREAK